VKLSDVADPGQNLVRPFVHRFLFFYIVFWHEIFEHDYCLFISSFGTFERNYTNEADVFHLYKYSDTVNLHTVSQ